jgi:hypothetical protein
MKLHPRADQAGAGAGARALPPAKALRATAGDRSQGDVPNRALRCRNWQGAWSPDRKTTLRETRAFEFCSHPGASPVRT